MMKKYEEFVTISAGPKMDVVGATLGLMGETGEVAELVKKNVYHDQPFDRQKTLKEMGDVFWYFTKLRLLWGFTIEEVMTTNINKLIERGHAKGFDPGYHNLQQDEEHA